VGRPHRRQIIYHRVHSLRNDLRSVQGLSQLFAANNWMTFWLKPCVRRGRLLVRWRGFAPRNANGLWLQVMPC
jgi:hypothetical protein